MMSESTSTTESAEIPGRPFPWYCPKCRRKEVWRVTMPYECERVHEGQPVEVVLENFTVPRCGHCGELVFDYEAEEQIRQMCEVARKSHHADEKITLTLSRSEAIVFVDFLMRYRDKELLTVDHDGEEQLLYDLCAIVENQLPELFDPQWRRIVERSRASVADTSKE